MGKEVVEETTGNKGISKEVEKDVAVEREASKFHELPKLENSLSEIMDRLLDVSPFLVHFPDTQREVYDALYNALAPLYRVYEKYRDRLSEEEFSKIIEDVSGLVNLG